MRNLLKESYEAVKSLFTAKHQATKWADEAHLPESLYGLLIEGRHTESRSLHLHEVVGVSELIRLRVKRPFPGVTVGSKLVEHPAKLVAYGKAKEYRHYDWVIIFQGAGRVVTIYLKSTNWEKSEVLSLQEIEPKHIYGSLVVWSDA